ncbi:MAG: hypothetical protein JRI56_00095 [Deltaproteobacteria bacterium]|nr:hypothetical protein [Deltaproteobacteria bacterium]
MNTDKIDLFCSVIEDIKRRVPELKHLELVVSDDGEEIVLLPLFISGQESLSIEESPEQLLLSLLNTLDNVRDEVSYVITKVNKLIADYLGE